jgi:hypothetical protein
MFSALYKFNGIDRLIDIVNRWGDVANDEGEGISSQ